jgi:pimeloyl-ACP methyl ester carboxylesterase
VSRDGTPLHVEIYGPDAAPTIVLAHGILMQVRNWAYQIEDLAGRYRVVAYDQRGHGRSGGDARTFTIDALGDDLQAVLDACVPAGERAIVAGHSMGGMTIMSWAGRYPDEVARRVAAVLLLNTAASAIIDHIAVIGVPRATHRIARALIKQKLLTIARNRARVPIRMLAFGSRAAREHVDAIMEMIRAAPDETVTQFVLAVADADLLATLPNITVPAVVVGGLQDRLLPPVHTRRIARRLPAVASLVLVPRSGHMTIWDHRALVSGLIASTADAHLSPVAS